jgi:hypothetical protein
MGGSPKISGALTAAALAGAAVVVTGPAAEAKGIAVPCSTPALVNAINRANTFTAATVRLSPKCIYTISTPATATDGLPVITGNVTILGGPSTTIRRDPALPPTATFRVLEVATGARLAVKGIFILNGRSNSLGGAILDNGTLVLNRVTISGNTASDGGAIAIVTGATATVSRSIISTNQATNIGGGGIVSIGTLTLIGSLVEANLAPFGGGLNNQPNAVANIVQSTFRANATTGSGGGIENLGGTVRLTRSLVERNTTDGVGGGINTNNPANVTLTKSIVRKNTPTNCTPLNTIPGCVG